MTELRDYLLAALALIIAAFYALGSMAGKERDGV